MQLGSAAWQKKAKSKKMMNQAEREQIDSSHKSEFGPIQLVVIQPTTFCNLDCDYCYLPDRQLKYKLSLDLLEPIFKNIFSSQFVGEKFTVVWHAGEPLTVPIAFYESAFQKINQLNEELKSNRCSISHSIQTNGTLIDQAWCNLIKKYKVKIGVSLDGPAFIHDAHRKTKKGIGTHASIMRGISLLQESNIDFNVIAVLTKDSLDYPDELFNFFLEQKIKYVGFNIEEIEGINKASSFGDVDIEERYRAFMQRFYELVKGTNGELRIREFENIRDFIYEKIDATKGQFTPFSMLNIKYNGEFSTFSPELLSIESSTYEDFILGNILHDSLESVCKTDKFQEMNQDIQAGVSLCKQSCRYFSLCGGGAPSNKYFENGSFRTSETMYCRYTKKVITDIVLEDIEISLGLRST